MANYNNGWAIWAMSRLAHSIKERREEKNRRNFKQIICKIFTWKHYTFSTNQFNKLLKLLSWSSFSVYP